MVQSLEELRGPDLASLLKLREKSLREATGTGSLSRYMKSRPKTGTIRSFSRSKVPTLDDDQASSEDKMPDSSPATPEEASY